jgi:hypothetical protein
MPRGSTRRGSRKSRRVHVAADVVDAAALAVRTVVGDDLDGIDAQSTGARDLPEAVERGVESHELRLVREGYDLDSSSGRRRRLSA